MNPIFAFLILSITASLYILVLSAAAAVSPWLAVLVVFGPFPLVYGVMLAAERAAERSAS